MTVTWKVDSYGDINVTCAPCGVSRRYRDTVDDVAWASLFMDSHRDCGATP